MIKKATLEEVVDLIDSAHEIENIKQLAGNSQNDGVRLASSTKLLEITGVITKDSKKTSVSGSNIQLVIEE
ncbi:MAG: hypothetical protein AAB922_01355 [Patescibacteria group bacterium]